MDIGMLERENIPCWYELGWRASRRWPAIIVRLHRDWIESAPLLDPETPIVANYEGIPGLKSFQGNFFHDWGFNGALKFKGIAGEFNEFEGPLPRIKESSGEPCGACDGSGWDELSYSDEKCRSCGGTGDGYVYSVERIYPLSASLSVLTNLIEFPDRRTSSPLLQLLTVNVRTCFQDEGGLVFALGGAYSISLVRWMSSFASMSDMSEMVDAMKAAYGRMFGMERIDARRFRVSIDPGNGWLNVECPGEACGLYPNDGSLHPGKGYRFSCHNVDNPMEQLALLAGLAALHDRARGEIR